MYYVLSQLNDLMTAILSRQTLSTVLLEIYAGTFFRGFECANVYAWTNIRGSALIILLYHCISCLRWYYIRG